MGRRVRELFDAEHGGFVVWYGSCMRMLESGDVISEEMFVSFASYDAIMESSSCRYLKV